MTIYVLQLAIQGTRILSLVGQMIFYGDQGTWLKHEIHNQTIYFNVLSL